MNYIFDKEKLNRVLLDFYESTGIAVTLYDAAERTVATSPVYCGCCTLIRSKDFCRENCDRSDLLHMREVSRNGYTVKYTCHAGLMETIIPVFYEDVLIAYLQIGQFRDEGEIYSSPKMIRKTAEMYGIDCDKLLSRYEEIPIVSEEKLQALCNIMGIIIRSFWNDGLIKYNRSMLSVKIERYIDEHITENIYIDELCREFYVSKNAIYRIFREEFNTTVNELIIKKRLDMSCGLLVNQTDLNVAQIALKCGFSDYNYFIRQFKKHKGETPLRFRKLNGEGTHKQ